MASLIITRNTGCASFNEAIITNTIRIRLFSSPPANALTINEISPKAIYAFATNFRVILITGITTYCMAMLTL